MRIVKRYKNSTDDEIWNGITNYIIQNKGFSSIRGVQYSAKCDNNSIIFKGDTPNTRRAIKDEVLSRIDILKAIRSIQDIEDIKTNTPVVIQYFPRQRSPFIALLKSTGILE